ncbi:hypothetical protein J2X69_004850 [Algoriphagus sp. 4150]|nr:hypothetical protein [Algoriphagus sp. 4150]
MATGIIADNHISFNAFPDNHINNIRSTVTFPKLGNGSCLKSGFSYSKVALKKPIIFLKARFSGFSNVFVN